ncbi:transporter substrate-binding domain-containing protein [Geomonas sp.]|uniref:transporter substrate-binding domain-containing protein n=1 Tax=Geomonas sp. TaxID=2651584 RepID=UPI002B497D31|nr:transporter substrate-binding domain-containing protein [Geomonas sp.]HJV33802.1 transporter substrate-binding domain-containing protein [Geomonas sp.]
MGKSFIRTALLALCALALVSGIAVAADSWSPAAPREIVVGGDRDYPPYEYLDQSGKPAGFNVELTRAIAEVMGMRVTFRLGGWSEMRTDLQNGKIDVLEGMSFSEERTREVDFSVPSAIVNQAIFARRDSPPVSALAELADKKVAVHRAGIMHDYLVRTGFHGKLELTATPADALRLVAAGRADYAVVAIVPGMYLIRELKLSNLVPVARSVAINRYGYAVKRGNVELLSRFNEGLAILHKTGQYDMLYNKWLGVLEPERFDWRTFVKYAAVVVIPLVLLLGTFALWSRTLHRQVALRTADLTREIAERKHAEAELRLNQQQLVQADKMAALGVLVSGVAHEINNPTGLILLDLPLLKKAHRDIRPILDEHQRQEGDFLLAGVPYSEMSVEMTRMLDEMQDGAQRIKRIVNDLKDFARRDDTGDKSAIDLNETVRTALRLVEPTIRRSTGRFRVELEDDIPNVLGNTQRIEQVVVNLVLNACQALPDQEHGITVTTRYNRTTSNAILVVRDEGVGIAAENLSKLTDPFFTTKRDSGGTGLGLSVSAGIIKEHNGTLTFDSTPGSGTTVTLSLPAASKESSA